MLISDAGTGCRVPIALPTVPSCPVNTKTSPNFIPFSHPVCLEMPTNWNKLSVAATCKYLPPNSCSNLSAPKLTAPNLSKKLKLVVNSASGDRSSVAFDVSIPRDYDELLEQASKATQLALKDNKQLMEIEFPTAGLDSVPGDGEGGIEMTGSIQLIRKFCDILINPEKARQTRIFFPEANEVEFARKSAFEGASFKLDYLTKPLFFEDFGFTEKVKMTDRVKPEDELFLAAYPYFNVTGSYKYPFLSLLGKVNAAETHTFTQEVHEMLVVEELYREAVLNTSRKLIIFNGELDRIRSGYYPSFFYPKLAALVKTLFPNMETVYYIHNFKGRNGGTLFRCYPGAWKVLRKVRDKYMCLQQQEAMPSLKEVALDILPSG